jgi:hypothetical protein
MSDLYSELAKALAQPSRGYRAAEVAANAVGNIDQGLQEYKKRKLGESTLIEALGGRVIPGAEAFQDMSINSLNQVSPGLKVISDFIPKEQKSADFLEPDQAEKFGVSKELMSTFTGKKIPRQLAQADVNNQVRHQIGSALQKRSDLQVASAINRNVNALTSGTGALATSGKNNLRIARVKSLLERTDQLTPQEMELVTTDLAGVVQGGVPLKDTVEGQAIGTVASRLANTLKQISNNPQTFNDLGFRRRIITLANEMIAADNQVQERAFANVAANFGHLTTPEHLQKVREAMRFGEQMPILTPEEVSSGEASKMSDEQLRLIATGAVNGGEE